MASDPNFRPTLRLHKLSWLFGLTLAIRQMGLPLLALFFFGARDDDTGQFGPYVVPVILVMLLARALWRQWTYRYGFGPNGLLVREGLLFRNVRQIEYGRIENIDTERGLLHRLLRVAEVRVQTSTGGKPEARISVLDLAAVQEMRDRVFGDNKPDANTVDAAAEATLLHLPTGELIRYGLIDNRGMIVVAAGVGVLHEAGMVNVGWHAIERLFPFSRDLFALGLMLQIALLAITVLGALITVRILSVALALVTLHDFRLTRQNGDLRARYGLFTRIALTLRTRRIQAVHQTESLLHRWLDRVTLNVDLAGDSGGGEQGEDVTTPRARWLAPVCPANAAPALIATALPSIDLSEEPDWQPLAPRARGRIFRKSAALAILILTVPAIWYLREGAILVVLGCIPLAWMHAHLYTKHTRWALAKDAVMFRSGWLTRRLTIVPRDRVQTMSLDASPFDRRSRMANIFVDTAGGGATRAGIRIRYLAADVAEKLATALYRTADASVAR
ncbi:MAG: PH domain-containing protein [Steroidobacter sp.]